jgi:dihydrofolate reductase
MRRIVAGLFTSLDGVTGSPDGWHARYLDGEVMAKLVELMGATDTMLFGGTTYDEFAGQWAGRRDSPSAEYFNAVPKYVVTSRTTAPAWQPVTQLRGDPRAEIAALRAKPGGAILVQGSMRLVRFLLAAGLLDELSLLVLPRIVGAGKRLFDGATPMGLALRETETFGNGVIRVSYRPAGGENQ